MSGSAYKTAGILFFDVKGYSTLNQPQMEAYHSIIWPILHRIAMETRGRTDAGKYLYKNTWGDGIVLVHENHYKLALVALAWMDYFTQGRYKTDAGPILSQAGLLPRIAIHYGEFQTVEDPFQARPGCFGKEIIHTARIEPITMPGHIWVTPTVKDFIESRENAEDAQLMKFKDHGEQELAKCFGTDRIYEVVWRSAPDDPEVGSAPDNPGAGSATAPPSAKQRRAEKATRMTDRTAKRIKTITNEDPRDYPVNLCSVTHDKTCPAKAESLRLIMDVARNGESAQEELTISSSVGVIGVCAENLARKLDAGQCIDVDLAILDLRIKKFLSQFAGFERDHDSIWEDKYRKALAFLKHRCVGSEKERHAIEFVEALRSFRDLPLPVDSYDTRAQLIKLVHGIQKDAPLFQVQLLTLGIDRIGKTRSALRMGFAKFSRFRLARHLRRTIRILFEESRSVPTNWSGEMVK